MGLMDVGMFLMLMVFFLILISWIFMGFLFLFGMYLLFLRCFFYSFLFVFSCRKRCIIVLFKVYFEGFKFLIDFLRGVFEGL